MPSKEDATAALDISLPSFPLYPNLETEGKMATILFRLANKTLISSLRKSN